MLGRLVALALGLLVVLAGCVTPAADLDAASVGALDGLAAAIPDATAQRLPDGDLALTLVGEVAGSVEHEFELPEGVTYVEAVVTSDAGPVNAILANADTRGTRCTPQTWTSWDGRGANGMRCTAIAAVDPASTWLVAVLGGALGGGPLDALPVPVAAASAPVPFELTLTFSTRPLDGPSGLLKLDALSRPVHEALEMEVVEVPASADGAGLHVEITRPDTDEKVPVIFRASPYNGPAQNAQGRAAGSLVDYWVPRGYAVAVMDLRGTGKSDGCFSMRAEVDQTDIADVVEHLGTQPWSNGKVGMHGISYEGFTPVAAAVQQPPHLATIFIGAPAIDTWSNYLPGGVQTGRSTSTVAGYTTGNAALTPADELPPDAVLHTVDAFCDPTVFPKGNDPRNLYDAWYAERNLTEQVADIQVPVFYEHGFWDNNVKANAVTDFFNALQVEKRGVFGSWQHIWAYRADQQLRLLAWMDHWLKGADTGILETPTVEVLTNTREWRAADAWPPLDATMVELALEGGDVVSVLPAAPAEARPGFAREVAIEQATYLSGVPLLELTLAMPLGGNAHLEARLHEVTADGTSLFAGVGWMNVAHRNGHDTFAPLAPGEETTITMKLLPQDHVLQPGSTLRVEVLSVTDNWGGPETGVGSTPGVLHVSSATLKLPTLPVATLAPQPRSAS